MFVELTQQAGQLSVSYRQYGDADGRPVYLLHGFPYDVHCYEEVAPALAAAGCRVLVPYLRGYGPTRFVDAQTPRSGEQAALGHDLLCLMDSLDTERAVVAGFDWGGRAACVVSALWPQRVIGLVSCGGYNIQNIAKAMRPADPLDEMKYWYQYYFHSERGRNGLEANREPLCRLLWELWSPDWQFTQACFERTSGAFANPDFVDVVIHSYRHRFGLAAGDPSIADVERQLAEQPTISVPTIVMQGMSDGVMSPQADARIAPRFARLVRIENLPAVGHNIPQESPAAFANAVLELL